MGWTNESLASTAQVVSDEAVAALEKTLSDELTQIGNRAGKQHRRDLDFCFTLALRLKSAALSVAGYDKAAGIAAERARIRRELIAALEGPDFGGHPPRTIRQMIAAVNRICPEEE